MSARLERARELLRDTILAYNDTSGAPETRDWFLAVQDDNIALIYYDDAAHENVEIGTFTLTQLS